MSEEQIYRLRSAMKDIFLPDHVLDNTELIQRQEVFEKVIHTILLQEVRKVIAIEVDFRQESMKVGMSVSDIGELRTAMGDAFLVMGKADWPEFERRITLIELWIEGLIDKQIMNIVAPNLRIRDKKSIDPKNN